jgi:6-pyruvoyltetrahydropterin/6-carboxytetrahydropterin synthase
MDQIIRVTREFSFEMAHVLGDYDGPCKNVHGHSYRLFVTVSGIPVKDNNNPKKGMVIDFSDLNRIVENTIINSFDHSVVISKDFEKGKADMLKNTFGNTMVVDYQPTCENLVYDFAERLACEFPEGVKLHSLRLYETAKSYAEWFASDNS